MAKQVLVTVGSSKIIARFNSGGGKPDGEKLKSAIFNQALENKVLREKLCQSGNFIMQKFCEDFDEYIDINESDSIEDKSKIKVVIVEEAEDERLDNGAEGVRPPLFPILSESQDRNSGPRPFGGSSGPMAFEGRDGPMPFQGRDGQTPFQGRGGQTPFQGRGGQTTFQGRGGPTPFQGRGGPTPFQGRGESMPFQGRGGLMPFQRGGGPMPFQGRDGPMPFQGRDGPMPFQGRDGPMPFQGRGGPMQSERGGGPRPPMGMSGSFLNSRGMGSSLPMPPSVHELDRISENRRRDPMPMFQGGSFLNSVPSGKGGPSKSSRNDDTGGFDFSRPFHEQRRSPEPSDELINLQKLLDEFEKRDRERSPRSDRHRRRSRSYSPKYRQRSRPHSPEYRRRRSPVSSHYRRRSRDRSPGYRRSDRDRSPGRGYSRYESDRHVGIRDHYYEDLRKMAPSPPDFHYERFNNGASRQVDDGGKKTKYTWDEVLEWEYEELGFKYKEPESVRQIYAAASRIRTKQPVQLLNEHAQQNVWKSPVFTLTVDGTGTREPTFQYQVEVNGSVFKAERYSSNKKQAKVYAAIKALYELGVI